jgi:hypothetical protein
MFYFNRFYLGVFNKYFDNRGDDRFIKYSMFKIT